MAARGGRGVLEQPPQHPDRLGQHLAVRGLEQGQLRFDGGGAVGPHGVEGADPVGRDADPHRAGIPGIDGSGDQPGVLEPPDLSGHRRLRTVIDGRQVADPGFPVGLDGGQQPGLGRGQGHLDALGGQPVEAGDDGE